MVGGVPPGGGAPVAVQSMLNAPADDVAANLAQIDALAQAGCEIVRMAVPRKSCLDAFSAVCEQSPLPVVADVHFSADIAWRPPAGARQSCASTPATSAGSMRPTPCWTRAARRASLSVSGERGFARCRAGGARRSCASGEAGPLGCGLRAPLRGPRFPRPGGQREGSRRDDHGAHVPPAQRGASARAPAYRRHRGGHGVPRTCQKRVRLGRSFGGGHRRHAAHRSPTIPATEVRACWTLLAALDLRRRGPELISCPTCGRCQVDLIALAREVEERIAGLDKPLKVAVMGCVVNGPGEAADADIGVACGKGSARCFPREPSSARWRRAPSWTL